MSGSVFNRKMKTRLGTEGITRQNPLQASIVMPCKAMTDSSIRDELRLFKNGNKPSHIGTDVNIEQARNEGLFNIYDGNLVLRKKKFRGLTRQVVSAQKLDGPVSSGIDNCVSSLNLYDPATVKSELEFLGIATMSADVHGRDSTYGTSSIAPVTMSGVVTTVNSSKQNIPPLTHLCWEVSANLNKDTKRLLNEPLLVPTLSGNMLFAYLRPCRDKATHPHDWLRDYAGMSLSFSVPGSYLFLFVASGPDTNSMFD